MPCPIPPPISQLAIRYHKVNITIQDQLAVTHVDQVFYNPNEWQVEGTYLFPIPLDAAVTSFTLWMDDQPVEAQILDANQARQKYEEIVRNLQDPALLEYAGRGAVQARIFPIPPQGERRVELEYTQALPAENGLVRYVYPLSTEKYSLYPLESVAINLDLRASVPIRAVYSPSHSISVTRESDSHIRAGYEDLNVLPDADFALYYSLGEEQAIHLMTYRDPGDATDPDGFFLLMLAPSPDAAATRLVAKDIILVLDRSGSMEGEKFFQAQEALRYILKHLHPEDRFNIIAFSTGVETFSSHLNTAAEIEAGLSWVDRLGAQGSTDINRALLEAAAMADPERTTYLIFLTDGLPTDGVVDSQRILENFNANAAPDLRLFTFGVGYDVDTYLLDSLAQAHHGASSYVLPGEPLDEILSAFYTRISSPVLTNLALDFGEISVYELYPSPLPDLFAGSQIILVGRYRQGGVSDVILTGEINGQKQTFRYGEQSFSRRSQPGGMEAAIARLWATRKIGYLLNQVRLNGPDQETIEQIVRLSIRYGIVTPYTSYLVTEDMPLGAAEQERIAIEQFNQLQATGAPPPSGQAAVEKAAQQGALSAADAPAAPAQETGQLVRIVGARTYVNQDGVWIDTAFDADRMETVKVAFLSDDYFSLANANPEIAAAFALSNRVIALAGGVAYEVVDKDSSPPVIDIPPTSTPEQELPAQTPAPTQAAANQTPVSEQPDTNTSIPCIGGLLPLALLPLLGWVVVKRKS
jgi:Ca-activated chloride channel family protein